MFTIPVVVVVLLTAALNVAAVPVSHSDPTVRSAEIAPSIEVCTGKVGTGCVTIPVVSDECVDFTGGLSFLNGEVSSAVVPGGFVCTFVENFGCDAVKGGSVVLQGGTWNFKKVPGTTGTTNFNDKASSFTCSPV